jgi:hypothetical protein
VLSFLEAKGRESFRERGETMTNCKRTKEKGDQGKTTQVGN